MVDSVIVLATGTFRETDMWIRFLGRNNGMQTAFAFGAKRSKRRFPGCLDVFNKLAIKAEHGKHGAFLQLKEATLTESYAWRTNWRLQGMAMNCIRFLEAMGISDENAEEIFDFVDTFFKALEAENKGKEVLAPLFRFKLLCLQGYAPQIEYCVRCGKKTEALKKVFVIHEGGLVCESCLNDGWGLGSSLNINMSKETLDLLEKVQENTFTQWASLCIPLSVAGEYGKAIDGFIQYHLNMEWHKNRYMRV